MAHASFLVLVAIFGLSRGSTLSKSPEIAEELIEKLKVIAEAAEPSTLNIVEAREEKIAQRSDSAHKSVVSETSSMDVSAENSVERQSLKSNSESPSDSETLPPSNVRSGEAESSIARHDRGLVSIVVALVLAVIVASAIFVRLNRPRVQVTRSVAAGLAQSNKPVVSADPDVDFGPYMAKLQRTLKQRWEARPELKKAPGSVVTVTFKVAESGKVSHVKVTGGSGNKDADDAGYKAANGAVLDPLPPGAPKVIDVEFTFTKSVFSIRNRLRGIHYTEQPRLGTGAE
jgi:TonB family protein